MLIQELATKQEMEQCSYCVEKKERVKSYIEDMEKQKIADCLKALEREKIAKGIQGTREDEKQLREIQKMQMYERKCLEQEEMDRENMWHQVLLDDVRRKEEQERIEADRRYQEMLDRRRAYDEQIASANRQRREALKEERERERRRLEKMREKMERDHYEATQRKKEQQNFNKSNFIEGHALKVARQRNEKLKERELDNETIRVALEQLRKDRIRQRNQMLSQRMEKEIFTENQNRERRIAKELEEEAENVAQEWKQDEERKTDEFLRQVENERRVQKEKAAHQYQKHLQELKAGIEQARAQRSERMQCVSRTAFQELRRRMDAADEELRRQVNYRNCLKAQINENQRTLESETNSTECRDWPFTRKSEMFDDIMQTRFKQTSARKSTNPIHPFKKVMETEEAKKTSSVQLPIIVGNKYHYIV